MHKYFNGIFTYIHTIPYIYIYIFSTVVGWLAIRIVGAVGDGLMDDGELNPSRRLLCGLRIFQNRMILVRIIGLEFNQSSESRALRPSTVSVVVY